MWSSTLRFFSLITVMLCTSPSVVTACEGECMVGITNAFLTNYTLQIHTVLSNVANEIVAQLLPNRRYSSPPLSILQPVYSRYKKEAYSQLEHDIFPSYFHGKCAQKDPDNPDAPAVDPPGCPNPDCRVVCGTPGSLVHFYPKLRYIAYNSTRNMLKTCGKEGQEEVVRNVQREIDAGEGGAKRRASDQVGLYHANSSRGAKHRRAAEHAKETVERLISGIPSRFEASCGGTGNGTTNRLKNCSWEREMKEYILSFP